MLKALRIVLLLLLLTTPATDLEAGRQFITIGTGGATGAYYPTGGSVCRLLNRSRKKHGIRCRVTSTGGSIYNLNAIRTGELEFGVVQSDWQYHAYNGTSTFKKVGPDHDLRAVFAIYAEPFTVVAAADSGIREFNDLKGKRVNIGNPGSDQRETMDAVMKAFGWTESDFILAAELNSTEQSSALCGRMVDAVVFTGSHPSSKIKELTSSCRAVLVPVQGHAIDRLLQDTTYYRHAIIPGGLYVGTERDTPTFGVGATLVTSAKVPDYVVYHLVKAVFDNFDHFRKLHPCFATLKREEMVRGGLSAPLHPGALRYYKEVGLLKW